MQGTPPPERDRSTHRRNDPYASFNFILNIEGMTAGFAEVGGLGNETDVIEYRDGNDDTATRKLSGLHKYTNITLKRGYTNSLDLWNWCKEVMDGGIRRLSGAITLFDEQRNPAAVWKFDHGWPVKWEAQIFDAKSNDVMIESLELRVEGLILE